MNALRARCRHLLDTLNRDAMLRQNDPVATLVAFVLAERGRDVAGDEVVPLVHYFADEAERDEFKTIWHEVHPAARTWKVP